MYSRFKALENFGEKELEDLKAATAAVVGLGATGSVVAEHLARHGVNLVIVDRDYLEQNDLYSSNLYIPEQCENSLPKAEAAKNILSAMTEVDSHMKHLGADNVSILSSADIIVDGTDNMETRFLTSEYSKHEGVPWVYTAALAEKGYSMLFDRKCFSCVFDEVKAGALETCETDGILRETAAIAASRSALKAVKYLAGKEVEEELEIVPGKERLEVDSRGCEVCGGESYPHLESSGEAVEVCGEHKYQLEREVGEEAFDRLRESGETVADNQYLTRVKVDGREFVLFRSGRAIVEAEDRGHAEARFDELVGG